MIRAFVGIPIIESDQSSVLHLLDHFKQDIADDLINWREPALWHITMRFLGNISAENIGTISQQVNLLSRGIQRFKVKVKRVAGFPSRQSRLVALHIKPHETLTQIFRALDEAVVGVGLNPERRRFRPHITLGKFKAKPRDYELLQTDDLMLHAQELVVYESKPNREGSHYIPLQRFPFMQ